MIALVKTTLMAALFAAAAVAAQAAPEAVPHTGHHPDASPPAASPGVADGPSASQTCPMAKGEKASGHMMGGQGMSRPDKGSAGGAEMGAKGRMAMNCMAAQAASGAAHDHPAARPQ